MARHYSLGLLLGGGKCELRLIVFHSPAHGGDAVPLVRLLLSRQREALRRVLVRR